MDWYTADRIFVDGRFETGVWLGVEDGAVRAVSRERPQAPVREFGDCAIFPGTVNTHTHAFHSMLRGCGDDLPLLEWLYDVVYKHAADFTPDDAYVGAALAFGEMLKNGITTVVDFFYLNGRGNEYALATIRAAEDLGIRLVLARTFMDWEKAPATIRETVPDARRRYGELAAGYGGHPTVRICPSAHSLYAASPAMIEAAAQAASERNTAWHMHVADARGPEEAIKRQHGRTTVGRMADLGVVRGDLVAIHAVYVDEKELDLLAERQVRVSHNPAANMFLGDRAARVARMRRIGMCVGLGTDGGLDNNTLSIFHEMKLAALVQKSTEADPQAITAADLTRMATVEGGRIAEQPLGSLAPGQLADFVVIDLSDIALVPGDRLESHMVYSMSDRAIRHVYVHGKAVVENGRLRGLEEAELRRRVVAATRRFFAAVQ
ncbi:MAG: amidohydrolase family protein [Burkholderiales bacterium]|nr:amidohydrolase family protein [Burkholderiales bacterium]